MERANRKICEDSNAVHVPNVDVPNVDSICSESVCISQLHRRADLLDRAVKNTVVNILTEKRVEILTSQLYSPSQLI